jgi:hypothetical protein
LAQQKQDFKIRINPEYEAIWQEFKSDEVYERLFQNIKKLGQLHPIIVNQHGIILDGHSRYHILHALKIELKYEILPFDDPLEEKLFVTTFNGDRDHLTDAQKIRWGKKIDETYEEIAKRNMSLGGKGCSIEQPLDRRKEVARRIGLSETQYHRGKTILEQDPELFKEKLDTGKETISGTFNEYSKKKNITDARNEILNDAPKIDLPANGVKLFLGDMRDFVNGPRSKEIPDNSVDVIPTDPPYDEPSLPLYTDLGKLAARVLKPGGSLITYIGQYALPEIIRRIEESGLTWYWPLAVILAGNKARMWQKGVFIEYKPLLWFIKGEKRMSGSGYIPDLIHSPKKPDKILHPWEQSPDEAEHVIKYLTIGPNQVVLDPFLGAGTTAIAAIKQNRKFIGIEIDEKTLDGAYANISTYLENKGSN